ncbi:DUF4114 domain-containing protein [Myxococcus sp. K38C18041901]|uniref:DUF4114 domain-containing protein n=1 Tax=Myxococcus guangdongensis TaxID=2906760 RepID=UPI0020A735A8|nr:DUF4114 domain-containing protein [Myxococcus guangdongensis]MCP3064933.1 DUF4114 domain-containing protein [Myxococcus guangdongensis]
MGCLLSLAATSAHADPASLALLPPRIESTAQSAEHVPSRSTSVLGVTASDPQGAPLTFTWTSTEGVLAPPVHGATTSEVTWTAPDCLPPSSAPVKVAVTNAFGLTSEVAFTFNVGGDLYVDYQKPFEPSQFSELHGISVSPQSLWLTPKQIPLNAERIVFEEPVSLSLQLVRKNAGGTHTLGWMYRDELVARGYVGPNDELLDTNGNGIADLHEDLYNLAPSSGPQARPYIGLWPRCPRSFFSGGFMYSEPGLAMNAGCQTTFRREMLADARPGQGSVRTLTEVVGRGLPDAHPNGFSDLGRYPRIPNLLEPALPENDFKGLGRLAFLITDDDEDGATYNQMGPVQDMRLTTPDGIPDYDVSAYTPEGVLRSQNPDPGITARDRKVAMGTIDPRREIVFFLVTYFEGIHNPRDAGLTFPCLKKAADGRCELFLETPVSVFFSKASWNMDMDVRGTSPAAEFAQGCTFRDTCNRAAPNNSGTSCSLPGTTQRLCGWLDAQAQTMLRRPEYGNIVLPAERLFVPASSNGAMPHMVVASSPAFPQRWLLGWEDLNGGGDRDFANAVFLLQAEPSGFARSTSITALPQDLDPRCFVSRVRVGKSDVFSPTCTPTSENFARYAISPECLSCADGTCFPNPSATWLNAPLAPGMSETVMDVRAFQGQSLCWQVAMGTRDFLCQPQVLNVNIGYELTRTP